MNNKKSYEIEYGFGENGYTYSVDYDRVDEVIEKKLMNLDKKELVDMIFELGYVNDKIYTMYEDEIKDYFGDEAYDEYQEEKFLRTHRGWVEY